MTLANFGCLLLVLEQANLELTSFLLNVGVLFLQGRPIFTFFSCAQGKPIEILLRALPSGLTRRAKILSAVQASRLKFNCELYLVAF